MFIMYNLFNIQFVFCSVNYQCWSVKCFVVMLCHNDSFIIVCHVYVGLSMLCCHSDAYMLLYYILIYACLLSIILFISCINVCELICYLCLLVCWLTQMASQPNYTVFSKFLFGIYYLFVIYVTIFVYYIHCTFVQRL